MGGTPAAISGLAKKGPDTALPISAASGGIERPLWFYTTTGGRQVFVKEVLGGAYIPRRNIFCRAMWTSMLQPSAMKQ